MKAVISSTYDNRYLYFIPIVTWCWNRLGVDVICFIPRLWKEDIKTEPRKSDYNKAVLVKRTMEELGMKFQLEAFNCPSHKEATYAQCSRLYGCCLSLPEDEVLIISDSDMANFKVPPCINYPITIYGSDLVPEGQFPMCYASGTVKAWREAFGINWYHKTYQFMLDELLGGIECENMRGNYWGKDQQTLWEKTKENTFLIPRARPNTQFADNRVDRDDINWRAYVNEDLVDAHLWRPGYTDENHANIMELMRMKFPDEDFQWLIDYNHAYKQLL